MLQASKYRPSPTSKRREQSSEAFFSCFLVGGSKASDFSADEFSIYRDDFGLTNKRRFRKSCIVPLLQDDVGDEAEAAKIARHNGDHIMFVQPSLRLREQTRRSDQPEA